MSEDAVAVLLGALITGALVILIAQAEGFLYAGKRRRLEEELKRWRSDEQD